MRDCRACIRAMAGMKDAGIWRKTLVTLKGKAQSHWARMLSERTIRMGLHVWRMKGACGVEFEEEVDSGD